MNAKKNRTPALFVSHGSPMNAIADNVFTEDLRKIGDQLKNVDAVLVISAHWETNGLVITSSEKLSTYHDFRGFPAELFEVEYPAKGATDLIPIIESMIGEPLQHDAKRGLDHGAWSMLVHLFPHANIPVLQLSLDRNKTFEEHYELAKKLAPLRAQNILILVSGNLTHNFSHLNFKDPNAPPFDWADQFDNTIKEAFVNNDSNTLIDIKNKSNVYHINHPSDDHYIPLLYLAGVRHEKDAVSFPHMSWQYGTMSMRHILLN